MKETAVVILNYNGEQHLRNFLPKVIEYSSDCHIVVADNCSTDGSVEYIKNNHPEVQLLLLSSNGGYSAGYNEALNQIEAEYYVLLNSDVEVSPNWVTPVIELIKSHDNIAAAQPKILAYNNKQEFEYAGAGGGYIDSLGYPFCRGRLFLSLEKDHGQFNNNTKIFWATGACLFIKASVFKEMGGLDPDFFAHMEEIDLCWRINSAGYDVMYCGESTVYHVGGGTLHKSNPRKTYLNFRNGLTLLYKNYSTRALWFKFPIRLLLDLIASAKFMCFDSFADGLAVLKAHFSFYAQFRSNYIKRKQTKKKRKTKNINTIYNGSIVFDYHIKGKRTFEELDF